MTERDGTFLKSSRGKESQVHKLREVWEAEHGGKAKFVQFVPVIEMSGGRPNSNTLVSVFDLRGCTSGAFRAYAWVYETPAGGETLVTVLHSPWIVGPTQAVHSMVTVKARAQQSTIVRPH
jgi:hypothetical protein